MIELLKEFKKVEGNKGTKKQFYRGVYRGGFKDPPFFYYFNLLF